MKASDLTTGGEERRAAASGLVSTETKNAVNTGLVGAADKSTKAMAREGRDGIGAGMLRENTRRRVAIDDVVENKDGSYTVFARKQGVLRDKRMTHTFEAGEVQDMSQKQLRREMSKKIRQNASPKKTWEPAKQKAKAAPKAIGAKAVNKTLEDTEFEGVDTAVYKTKAAVKTTKWLSPKSRAARREAKQMSVEQLAKVKEKERIAKLQQAQRQVQSKGNQARAMRQTVQHVENTSKAARASAAAASSAGSSAAAAAGCLPILVLFFIAFALLCAIVSGVFGGVYDEEEGEYASLSEVENQVASFFKEKGLDNIQIAAIMGNMYAESGMDPSKHQIGGSAIGICQWDGSRKTNLLNYADSQGVDWTDLSLQLDFFWDHDTWDGWSGSYYDANGNHVNGSKTGFMNATTVADATAQFCYGWERPSIPRISERISRAEYYYDILEGSYSSYVNAALSYANDDTHGYSQSTSDGGSGRGCNPDMDCSSFVYYSLLAAGYTTDQIGSYAFNTGGMYSALTNAGFTRYEFTSVSDLKAGDIVWRDGHTEIYIGGYQTVGAHWNKDGKVGDSGGNEICVADCSSNYTYYFRLEN